MITAVQLLQVSEISRVGAEEFINCDLNCGAVKLSTSTPA